MQDRNDSRGRQAVAGKVGQHMDVAEFRPLGGNCHGVAFVVEGMFFFILELQTSQNFYCNAQTGMRVQIFSR